VIVLAIFIGVVFLVSLLSRRIDGSLLTAPMIFTAAGALTFALPAAR